MKISELQAACKYDDSTMEEVKNCHPKQIASEVIPIPTWKIKYKYTTARGNPKETQKQYSIIHHLTVLIHIRWLNDFRIAKL